MSEPQLLERILGRRPRRVVVVNDARPMLDLYRHMLEELGYEAVLLITEAIETDRIRAAAPDAVILDLEVGLQTEYGVAMAKELRSDRQYGRLPIVVATASADGLDGARQTLEDIGVPILLKPFTADTLGRLLEPAVSEAGATVE